jgi:citronellyl-CoA dehydrogenase
VLGEAGLLGIEYDPAYGGQGLDHMHTMIFGEELGRIPSMGIFTGIAVQTDMATPSLHQFGTHELKEEFLRPAIEGTQVCAIAVTEPGAGSDVASLRTHGRRDGDDWVINGSKIFITNGVQADWFCLLARTSDDGGAHGISQIVVPSSTPGVSISRSMKKLGNRASDTAELSFDDVRVPVSNTIGEAGRGFHQQMQQFQNERMIAAYMAVGGMMDALEKTRERLRERGPSNGSGDNQGLHFQLSELAAELDMLRSYTHTFAEDVLRGEATQRQATITKLKAGRLQRQVADCCVQAYGNDGYLEDNWAARYFRDARLLSIGGGTDEIMLRTLARIDGLPA